MFQRFFENTIESQFIKNLIANTSIPTIPSVNSHDYIIKSMKYVYGDVIIECLKTGYVTRYHSSISEDNVAKYRVLENYILGDNSSQYTERYISKDKYYDSETHYHLGRLLRLIRDTQFIDLMPFYNCFNYKVLAGSIKEKTVKDKTTGEDKKGYYYTSDNQSQYKVFAVPIRFNTTYTIALDSYTTTYITPILYCEQGEIKDASNKSLLMVPAKKYSHMNFLKPITFSVNLGKVDSSGKSLDNNDSESIYAQTNLIGHYEKYLYLLIQLPASINTSIVVLEGDYTHSKCTKIINAEDTDVVNINSGLIYNPSLLLWNDKKIYAYSDRLIEHLLLSPICSSEDIWKNIGYVQNLADMTKSEGFVENVWTPQMRLELFNRYLVDSTKDLDSLKTDVNGYANHNIEKLLLRGRM